jgi:hypothetical protein
VIADLGVNHVERQILLCGFSVERIRMDYGIDLIVHTYSRRGEIENGRVLFQVKATNRARISADSDSVSCIVEKADLHYWSGELMPVVLVQYDVQREIARWLHVQEHLASLAWADLSGAGKKITIDIPRVNVFDRHAMRLIVRKKNSIVSGEKEGN